jgi:hypothetical protein
LVLRAADAPAASVAMRRRLRAAVAVAVVILTIPKETLLLLSLPMPTAPATAPLISAHLFAGLLLFAAAVSGARGLALEARASSRTESGATMSPNDSKGAYSAPQ